jgi:hypothetical protein
VVVVVTVVVAVVVRGGGVSGYGGSINFLGDTSNQ